MSRRRDSKAQCQANVGKIQGIQGQLLELAVRHPRTNAAEQALIWLVTHKPSRPNRTRPGSSWPGITRGAIGSSRSSPVSSRSTGPPGPSRNSCATPWSRTPIARSGAWPATGWRRSSSIGRRSCGSGRCSPPGWPRCGAERFSPQDLDRVVKQDPKALEDEAARLYERIIAEFPLRRQQRLPHRAAAADPRPGCAVQLPEVARVHLDELRRLSVGKPAPEIEGVDLDGQPMKLSDFRGKVVVLFVAGFGVHSTARPDRAASLHRRRSSAGSPRPSRASRSPCWASSSPFAKSTRRRSQASGLPIRFWWDPQQEGQPEFAGRVWGPGPGRSSPPGTPRSPTGT